MKLGKYVLVRRIGAGGMGVVYEAHDPTLNRTVAIKLCRPNTGRRRSAAIQGRGESRRPGQPPNCIHIYDQKRTTDGRFWSWSWSAG